MRTQNHPKNLEAWKLRNKVSNLVHGERRYNVHGMIVFEFTHHTVEPDLALLQISILEVDREFPWRDDLHPDTTGESIRYLHVGKPVIQNWTIPEKSCVCTIFPLCENLRRPQVYAYEKYLAKLAEEMAKRKLPEVKEVRSIISMRAATSFSA